MVDDGFEPMFVIGVITLTTVPSGESNLNPIDFGTAWLNWTASVTNSTKSFDPLGFVTFSEAVVFAPLLFIEALMNPDCAKVDAKVPLLLAV